MAEETEVKKTIACNFAARLRQNKAVKTYSNRTLRLGLSRQGQPYSAFQTDIRRCEKTL